FVLAGVSACGCSKKEEARERSSPTSGSVASEAGPKATAERAPARPEGPTGADRTDRASPSSPMKDSLIAGSGKGGEKRWDKPASREAKGAEAMLAAGGPGAKKPPAPAQMDLPEGGLLTAGSFDDNLYPGPLRTFLKKISRDQSAQDLPARFL